MRFLRCGEHAILVELDSLDDVLGRYRALCRKPPTGSGDLVLASRTILVHFDPALTTVDHLMAEIADTPPLLGSDVSERLVEIPVKYDGEDLDEVAGRSGLSVSEVIASHTGSELLAAFVGFAPGFCYITGLPEPLRLPRRDTPRTRVPAGAVALGGGYTAVYPRDSPGGWHVIGHTDESMWDIDADPPALLTPGTRVRFAEVGA
ncbi:MAG: 5-oxoprolinase subunit B family protein [Stackebrandtia sp.]